MAIDLIALSAIQLALVYQGQSQDYFYLDVFETAKDCFYVLILVAGTVFGCFSILPLFLFHSRLVYHGVSTNEYLKGDFKAFHGFNPYQ